MDKLWDTPQKLLVIEGDTLFEYVVAPGYEGLTLKNKGRMRWLDDRRVQIGLDTLTIRRYGVSLIVECSWGKAGERLRQFYRHLPRANQGPALAALQNQLYRTPQTLHYRLRTKAQPSPHTLHYLPEEDWVLWEGGAGQLRAERWFFQTVGNELYLHRFLPEYSLDEGYHVVRGAPHFIELISISNLDTLRLVPDPQEAGNASLLSGRWKMAAQSDVQALLDHANGALQRPSTWHYDNELEAERWSVDFKDSIIITERTSPETHLPVRTDTLSYRQSAHGQFMGLYFSLLFSEPQDRLRIWVIQPVGSDWLFLEEKRTAHTGKRRLHRFYLQRDTMAVE